MIRKFTFLCLAVLSLITARAGFTPVTVSGFTRDVVANGVGLAQTSTTFPVDDTIITQGYAFLSSDYRQTSGATAPTYALPMNGVINSAVTAGLSYQLANYSAANSLALFRQGMSGTLHFTTPLNASDVYVLATSGGGASTGTIFNVTFTDSTTQTFTYTVADWYNGAGFAIQGIGRVSLASGAPDAGGGTTNPRLYEYRLSLSAANYSKQIAYVSVGKTNATGTGYIHVMAVSVNTVAPCGPPTSQPTNLVLTPTVYGVSGSFSASVPPANKYIVLRSMGGPANTPPSDGVTYTVGQVIDNATVVSVAAGTTFNDPGLTIGATYYYTILGFNDSTCYGVSPAYNITPPLIGSTTIPSCSPTSGGTYTVGPTGTYPTLTAAMTALNNAAGASGNIIIELQAAYTSTAETFPIVIPNISTSPCAVGNPTLTIRPAAGSTGLVITGSNATAILDFNGAKNATLDGRPGGTGTAIQLTVINTNTTGVAIRLYNDASRNTITYCDIQGQNTGTTSSALSGVIYIGQAAAGTSMGNDNNTISFNRIHGTTGGTPAIGISAYGSTTTVNSYNDSCTISNNSIYDYFHAAAATSGIKLDLGNNAWNITNNSLYQTASRTYTSAFTHRGLWITPNVAAITNTAGNFTITGNFIGGTAASAAGTAYTMTGSNATLFFGMDLSVGGGTATSVQGNVITNISLTSTSTTTTGVFIGINTANGNINIGNQEPNTIGSGSAAAAIFVRTALSGTTFGIRAGGGNTINIANNVVGGISVNGTSNTISSNLTGIGVTAGTTVDVTGNLVGSTTVAGSLSAAASSSTTSQSINGISITGGTTTTVVNNTLANFTNGYTGTSTIAVTRGINVTTSASQISGNTIFNLSSTAPSTGGGSSSSLQGIALTSTNSAGCNVTGNTIYSLVSTSTSTTAAINITGIFYSGTSSTTSSINKNRIHSLEGTAVDSNIVTTGIDYASATAVVSNNYIRLGIKADGSSYTTASVFRGISANSSTGLNTILHNTIYIGGTGVGNTTKPSYAFVRTSTSGTYDIRNNIFVNVRSNASVGGKHYAIYYTGSTTGVAANNNVYLANGTGGVFGYNGTADVATYTSGWIPGDVSSAYGDPGFINATGNAATFDLHINPAVPSIAESAGSPATFFVPDDFDGNPRNANMPDAGADEFAGVNPNLCTGTPVAGTVSSSISQVCVGTSFTLFVSGSTSNPGISFQWQSSPDSTTWTNISGANTSTYTTTLTAKTFFRVVVTCSGSSSSATSGGISVSIFNPVYAIYNGTLYTESFENWASTCSTNDIPSVNWRTSPSTGNNSWRRNDQAATAGWVNPTSGAYSPTFTLGSYSARFHSYQASSGTQGTMDFFVNMSAAGPATNLKFDYINTSGSDSMVVFLSTDGGATFSRLDSIRIRSAWTTKTIPLNTSSATTIIRFVATSDFGTTDIGMDNLQLVNFSQCTGTPNAGIVFSSANPACSGVNFTLSDTTATQLSGITYQWQSSPDSTTWTNIAGATTTTYTTSQTAVTYYRLVVTCAGSSSSATTAGIKITLNVPTACYCTPTYANGGANDYVTSVALLNLTQTTAANTTPYYLNYTATQNAVPNLSRTNSYPLHLTFGSDGTQYSGVWIDFNQDGVFATTEYFSRSRNVGGSGKDTITIIVPANATLGQTRMRIRGGEDVVLTSAHACGASSSGYGQAQDYMVNITDIVTPVSLLSFKGERKMNANLLSWTTASELNNAGFELQRSADGSLFSSLGFIASKAANGNSNSRLDYDFTDVRALKGNNYYRLKQTDKDGKVSYSTIVLLKGDKLNALTLSVVYPNPVHTRLNVIIASPKADKLTLILSDVTGKIVQQQNVLAATGDNKYEVNVQQLPAGNYIIKAICNDGCETVISKFTKQ